MDAEGILSLYHELAHDERQNNSKDKGLHIFTYDGLGFPLPHACLIALDSVHLVICPCACHPTPSRHTAHARVPADTLANSVATPAGR